MDTLEIKIQLPKEVSSGISDLSKYTYEKLILGLYLDGEISMGKAANMLDMAYDQFVQYLGEHHILYFHANPEDIKKELNQLQCH